MDASPGIPNSPRTGAVDGKNNKKTRAYTGWNEEEAERFFEGIKVFGRDFQRLSNHIGSKSYDQVRHFYYRLIKKMNALLESLGRGVNKSDKDEVRESILFWYEFFKPKGKLTGAPVPGGEEANKLAAALLEFLQTRATTPSKYPPIPEPAQRHKTLLPKTHVERLNSVIQQIGNTRLLVKAVSAPALPLVHPPTPLPSSPETVAATTTSTTSTVSVPSSPPKRITLQLIPKNTKVSNQIATAGYNPLLQLTYSSKKPISYIINHMMKKWTREVNGTEVPLATGPIRLYAVPPQDHYSWGVESDDVTSASIYQLLSCNGVMQLLYSWLEEKENINDERNAAATTTTSTTTAASASSNSSQPPSHSNHARLETRITPASPLLKKETREIEPPPPLVSLPAPLLSPIIPRPRSPSFSAQSPTSPSRFFALTPTKSPGFLATSPSNNFGLLSPSGVSPKFKVPDTPNILSLSFFNEPSQDGFQAAENDEKECREFYKEFDAASHDVHDEDSGFAKFFKSARLEEDSSPIRRRLDFSSFSILDSPAPSGIMMTSGGGGISGSNKRRLSDMVASGREDSEDGDGLFGLATATGNKRKKLSFGGSMPLLPTTSPSSALSPTHPESAAKPPTSSVNVSLDSLLEETNSNSCFNSYWMAETSNG